MMCWAFLSSLLLLAPVCFSLPTEAHRKPQFRWSDTEYFIAFGDSYTYVQGTLGYANSTFLGDLQHLYPSANTLFADRIVQNQTSTANGGPNWVEFLTGCAVKPGLYNPRSCRPQLWDFAFGGSDITEEYLPLHHNYTVSLVNQVSQFTNSAYPALRSQNLIRPERSLVAIWIGINDIGDTRKNTTDFAAWYDKEITRLFQAVDSIHSLGYNDFLMLNLPPLDKRPGNAGSKSPYPDATLVQLWDDTLAKHAADYGQQVGANVMLFDANAALNEIIANAASYGYTNTTGYCPGYNQPDIEYNYAAYGCRPLHEYFWYNTGHMTVHTHRILAGRIQQFLDNSG